MGMTWVGPEDASGRLRWQRIPGGYLNSDFLNGSRKDTTGEITLLFQYAAPHHWGEVKLFWMPPIAGNPVPQGSIGGQKRNWLQVFSVDGHQFVAQCANLPVSRSNFKESWLVNATLGQTQQYDVILDCRRKRQPKATRSEL